MYAKTASLIAALNFTNWFYTPSQEPKKSYMPVVLVHGICSDATHMEPLKHSIEQKFPGTYVNCLKYGNHEELTSLEGTEKQLDLINTAIEADPNLKQKFILIGHSQGGLLARWWFQKYCNSENPRVHTLISLGSPQAGYYGVPEMLKNQAEVHHSDQSLEEHGERLSLVKNLLNTTEEEAYKILYKPESQELLSLASYWKDPFHLPEYVTECKALPIYNNEIDHPRSQQFSTTINSLKKIVLVMSLIDEVIKPRESCLFKFFNPDSNTIQHSFFQTSQYKGNLLELDQLCRDQRLAFETVECAHTDFQTNEKVQKLVNYYINEANRR